MTDLGRLYPLTFFEQYRYGNLAAKTMGKSTEIRKIIAPFRELTNHNLVYPRVPQWSFRAVHFLDEKWFAMPSIMRS